MFTLSACFMMPLMVGAIYNSAMNDREDAKIKAAVSELIEESVGALGDERGIFDRIFIGEITISDELISVRKFRQILLETVPTNNMSQVLEPDDRADSALGSQKVLTVLNIQFYQTGDRIWLAQQLVDMQTNRILWSGIHGRPLFNSTQDPHDDTFFI
jgi:hypothetical protein